jgi:hypothetical protein
VRCGGLRFLEKICLTHVSVVIFLVGYGAKQRMNDSIFNKLLKCEAC